MNLTLHVWRQKNTADPGRMVAYQAKDIFPDMSFLEMLDVVNQELIEKGEDPIAPFAKKVSAVLDHLVKEGYTDAKHVGVAGTSPFVAARRNS